MTKPKPLSLTPATALSVGIIIVALAIAATIALPGNGVDVGETFLTRFDEEDWPRIDDLLS